MDNRQVGAGALSVIRWCPLSIQWSLHALAVTQRSPGYATGHLVKYPNRGWASIQNITCIYTSTAVLYVHVIPLLAAPELSVLAMGSQQQWLTCTLLAPAIIIIAV